MSEIKKVLGKKHLPTLSIATLMLMTFGNLGTSMAFSLQSANMGRIFQTLGADPTKLGFFFIFHHWQEWLFNH